MPSDLPHHAWCALEAIQVQGLLFCRGRPMVREGSKRVPDYSNPDVQFRFLIAENRHSAPGQIWILALIPRMTASGRVHATVRATTNVRYAFRLPEAAVQLSATTGRSDQQPGTSAKGRQLPFPAPRRTALSSRRVRMARRCVDPLDPVQPRSAGGDEQVAAGGVTRPRVVRPRH
jgi:hypothetical protein